MQQLREFVNQQLHEWNLGALTSEEYDRQSCPQSHISGTNEESQHSSLFV